MVIIGPFSGVLADRWNRKKILLATDFLQALATVGLIILFWMNIVEIWHILLLIAIRGAFQAFQMPASVSIVPQMVPKNQISRINGFGQFFNNFIFILSPILGAIILEVTSISVILWIDVITFLVAVFSLILVTIPPLIRKSTNGIEPKTPSFKAQFFETFDYLKDHGWLPLIIGFTLGNILINPLFMLLPLFIKDVHLGGAPDLAFVVAIFQVGSLLGAFLIAVINF
ncbi:MAG: MFS transporter, partial [Candidatus Hodarchaeales archaeon]